MTQVAKGSYVKPSTQPTVKYRTVKNRCGCGNSRKAAPAKAALSGTGTQQFAYGASPHLPTAQAPNVGARPPAGFPFGAGLHPYGPGVYSAGLAPLLYGGVPYPYGWGPQGIGYGAYQAGPGALLPGIGQLLLGAGPFSPGIGAFMHGPSHHSIGWGPHAHGPYQPGPRMDPESAQFPRRPITGPAGQ